MREVIIHWLDSAGEDAAIPLVGAQNCSIYKCRTMGFIVFEDDKQINLSMEEYVPDEEDCGTTLYRHTVAIPKISILFVEEVRIK